MTRNTKSKQLFIGIVNTSSSPLTLEEIFAIMKMQLPNVAFSTVFRLAKTLEKQGLITKVDWRERGSRYERANQDHHHHIVCSICGKYTDVTESCFVINDKQIQQNTGYTVARHNIELEGVCPDCQIKKPLSN